MRQFTSSTSYAALALGLGALILGATGPLAAEAAPRAKPSKPTATALPKIDIPFEKFVLKNGLTVIVHEDHKAPVVAVNIWYHVGSGHEPKGRSGFAHLFEHLMFAGSEHNKEVWFKAMDPLGGTDVNGTTNTDRTNFFETVPTAGLDKVLYLESDRMGTLLTTVDQGLLDQQRGVVQNEKRQNENQPYGKVWGAITRYTYAADHPYGHTVIGEMEDLNAAKLEDVHEWFKSYYGPSNAVLVLAGDIDAKTAREKVEKYFGNLPAGQPVPRTLNWVSKLNGPRRAELFDRVPQGRFLKVWNGPEQISDDATRLKLLAAVLGSGKTSRLYQRLVQKDQLATQANAFFVTREYGGQFVVSVTAKDGVELSKLEAIIQDEMQALLKSGPTPAELDRIKVLTFAGAARSLERVGGFGGKSDWLAESQTFRGTPDGYKRELEVVSTATPADLLKTGRTWLDDNALSISVKPFKASDGQPNGFDRSNAPSVGAMVAPKWEDPQTATLSNGLKILFVPRHATPVVNLELVFNRGDGSTLQGAGVLAMQMLQEGSGRNSATEAAEARERLGLNLSARADLTHSGVGISALSSNLGQSLDLMADAVRRPRFETADFERLKKLYVEQVKASKSQPNTLASEAYRPLVFGPNHPLARINSVEKASKLSLDQAKDFYDRLDPSQATVIVVGDTDLATLKAQLETRFGDWKAAKPALEKVDLTKTQSAKAGIYLVDKPGALQSVIWGGNLSSSLNPATEPSVDVFNATLGDGFSSRLNMNLREDKHWAYGAHGGFSGAGAARAYVGQAPVQTNKTKESVIEVKKELTEILSSRPVTEAELKASKGQLINSLPGTFETASSVLAYNKDILVRDLPKDYYATYAARIQAVTLEDTATAAKSVLKPDETFIVVVGDRTKVEAGLNELAKSWGYGPVQLIKLDGDK